MSGRRKRWLGPATGFAGGFVKEDGIDNRAQSTIIRDADIQNMTHPTVIRMRGRQTLACYIDPETVTSGDPRGGNYCWGIYVASSTISAATDLPDPAVDLDADWLYWQIFDLIALRIHDESSDPERAENRVRQAATVNASSCIWEHDSKAMRKIKPKQSIFFVSHWNTDDAAVKLFHAEGFRFLFME